MARKVRQMRRKGKHVGLVPAPVTTAPDIDARVALIQALIPVALDKVMEELQADVEHKQRAAYRISTTNGIDSATFNLSSTRPHGRPHRSTRSSCPHRHPQRKTTVLDVL